MSILANNKISDGQFVRDNGWTRPWNKYQIATWITLFVFALIAWGVEIISLHPNAWAAAYTVTGVLFVMVTILLIVTTGIDPSDDNSLEHRKRTKKAAAIFDRSKHKHVIESGFCHICECIVLESSKHCQPCNKCVKGFDHHCMWLNNCIGTKNYGLFLALLAVALMGCIAMLGIGLFVFFNAFFNNYLLNPDIWWWQLSGGFVAFEIIIGIKIILLVVAAALICQLGVFHMMLIHRKQTTYMHFKKQEEKRELQKKLASETERSLNFDDMPVPACSERQSEHATGGGERVSSPADLKEDPNTFSNINHSYAVDVA